MPIDRANAEKANILHWDEVAPIHLKSYQIDDLLNGVSRIDDIQKMEFYPVKSKDLIHLQCHIGTDTLSLAIDGANVTGVDFSSKSIAIANDLARTLKINARFIEANVLDLYNKISTKYDIVYTSKGVLCWIGDINKWAETISYLLKDNGIFYIMETHPAYLMFDENEIENLAIKYPYFQQKAPIHFDDDHPDYADNSYIPKNKTYEWIWSLSDIMNALLRNGLTIELFNEYDRLFYRGHPGMIKDSNGWWYLKKYEGMIPMTFSLRARKRS